MARVIAEVEAEQQIAPTKREARFEDTVEAWFAHLEFEKRAKPRPWRANGTCSPLRVPEREANEGRGSSGSSPAASSDRSRQSRRT
jgi:hypothetical protein